LKILRGACEIQELQKVNLSKRCICLDKKKTQRYGTLVEEILFEVKHTKRAHAQAKKILEIKK
jgi:hypothetical protein